MNQSTTVDGKAAPGEVRLGDTIYARLRNDIVLGILRPNQRLVESEVAERLNGSRTPVRESLHRLGQEGLVHRYRGGWIVHEHTIAEIRQIYEIRLALEGYAARLAAERGDLDYLRSLDDRFHEPEDLSSQHLTGELNTEFHDAIVIASKNARLLDLVRQSREYAFNERIAKVYTPEELRRASEDHRELIAAVLQQDGDLAEEIARRHVRNSLKIIEARFA
jgi:DNA-binding GntR family transcriptional regulator